MAMGKVGWSILDHDEETSNISLWIGVVTAGNLAGVLTQTGALRTAIEGISLGTVTKEDLLVASSNQNAAIPPADPNAQRETKALVSYTDVTEFFDAPTNSIPNEGFGNRFTTEIPCADLSLLTLNSDRFDLEGTEWAAFVTAFEALIKSPYGGAVQVLNARHVGRRI